MIISIFNFILGVQFFDELAEKEAPGGFLGAGDIANKRFKDKYKDSLSLISKEINKHSPVNCGGAYFKPKKFILEHPNPASRSVLCKIYHL